MSRLKNVGDRFKAVYKTVTGQEFYGQILEPPDTSRVSNFLSARRYLRTKPETKVRPRNVVLIDNNKYIVAEHGTGFYVVPIYKHFKLFEVDIELLGYRQRTTKNPITGIKQIVRDQPLGKVYLSLQPTASSDDSILIPQENKIAISDKELRVEDQIGNYIVVKADNVLGVTLVELKSL